MKGQFAGAMFIALGLYYGSSLHCSNHGGE